MSPRLWRRRGTDEPRPVRGGDVARLERPDGTVLQVEAYGPPEAPAIVLTHGWGGDATEWYYAKRQLGDRFRLVVWDLPGLGRSTQPKDRDYSLEKMATDLRAVIDVARGQPVTLLGHSIGGMIILTLSRLFPETLGSTVSAIVLAHTTYTNPLRTMKRAALWTALQKPVVEPLAHLMIWLSPLVRVLNWLSYLNGTIHWNMARQSFAGTETRGQLDFAARFALKTSPAVFARGCLGMLRYDATAALGAIGVPVLVVAGDRDTTTLPEASERIRASVPSGRLATLSPAKHLGPIERNTEFSRIVGDFCVPSLPR